MVSGAVVGAGIAGAGQAPAVSLIAQEPPIRAFYVDATNGNDANSGLAPWDAWLTLAKVNGETFDPYDVIRLQGLFREQLTLPSSGTDGRYIRIESYGTGATINGADLVTTWALHGGSTYSKAWGSADLVVVEDGTRLDIGTDKDALNSGEFIHDTGVLYVRCTDDADPDTHTMEVANRSYCIDSNGQDYVIIQDIQFQYPKSTNIDMQGATDWFIQRVTFGACRLHHIQTRVAACQSLTIRNCVMNDAGRESIYLDTAMHTAGNVSIEDNIIICTDWESGTEGDGIDIKSGSSASIMVSHNTIDLSSVPDAGSAVGIIFASPAIVESNTITDPIRAGIQTGTGAAASVIRYNAVTQSRAGLAIPLHGLEVYGDDYEVYYNILVFTGSTTNDFYGLHFGSGADHDGCNVYNNVAYGWKRGFLCTGDLTNFNLKNNIFYEFTTRGIHLGDPASLICDNNDVYTTQGGAQYGTHNAVDYAALANWQAGTTYGDDSIEGDPLFTSPPSDLTLQSGSPCRNAGADVGLTTDYSGVDVPQETNPAIGAREYVP